MNYPYFSGVLRGKLEIIGFELYRKNLINYKDIEKINEFVDNIIKEAEESAKEYSELEH